MKVELAKPIKEIPKGTQVIPMQLYLHDNKKRDLHKGDEAIAFEFIAGNDDPVEIAKEMVCTQAILDGPIFALYCNLCRLCFFFPTAAVAGG